MGPFSFNPMSLSSSTEEVEVKVMERIGQDLNPRILGGGGSVYS